MTELNLDAMLRERRLMRRSSQWPAIVAAIREEVPDASDQDLEDLLAACEDLHLAHFGRPLYEDAGPNGELTEGQLNTIGYTASRHLSGEPPEYDGPQLDPAEVKAWLAGSTPRPDTPVDDIESLRARLNR
jgi:hypothetical protein